MELITIHKFSKLIGKTPQTLRNWDKSGLLKPSYVGKSG
ncbi:MerR family transcriptional regulator, partial [Patescibacteria group bacterium]|nr:MerR family transcriptional regulator [Patescibacteria group bacterium]MBU1992042.1 MerR family transcriptional regulator [Patescibacteria group bacterium]